MDYTNKIATGLVLQHGSLSNALTVWLSDTTTINFPKEERLFLIDYSIMINPPGQPFPNDV